LYLADSSLARCYAGATAWAGRSFVQRFRRHQPFLCALERPSSGIVRHMGLEDLARRLSDTNRIGLNPELAKRLGLASEDVTRGRLMAQLEGDASHLGVYIVACYVVDDTDFWGDGEIYWWTIPTIVDQAGQVSKNSLCSLPTGQAPHKVGSLEWMTSFSLADPPLIAVIPPGNEVAACVIRVAFYDDDGAAADVPKALTAGLEMLADLSDEPLSGPEQIILPVRHAIWTSLRADQDDILVDQDVTLHHGEVVRFGAGMIGSVINAMARVYYFVKDETRTERFGPIALHKGQVETVKFSQPMRGGGRLAMFARGAEVNCSAFGDLNTDLPFQNRVIDRRQEGGLERGFNIAGSGAAKFVAYYTPPSG
jgi:hypothetical protein